MCENLDFFKFLFYKTKIYVSMCLIYFMNNNQWVLINAFVNNFRFVISVKKA